MAYYSLNFNQSQVQSFLHFQPIKVEIIVHQNFKVTYYQGCFDFQNAKEDILSRFLIESKKYKETMTDQYLRDIILNFMVAGKDTSANTLSWFFYMLCKNPLIEEKIVQEVRDVTCSHESEESIDKFVAKITDDTLDKMHYLHAALTETLRLYPAVPVVPSMKLSHKHIVCISREFLL